MAKTEMERALEADGEKLRQLTGEDHGPWSECDYCGGTGLQAGCFEDTCCGADCDPEDPEYCCAPSRCDMCRGNGGWGPDVPAITNGQHGEGDGSKSREQGGGE
jgi:hypothetical protein